MKARNGTRHSKQTREKAILLRRRGRTHREIARSLNISLGSAFLWTKETRITRVQKQAIEARRKRHYMTQEERRQLSIRVKKLQFKPKYTDEDLINKIKDFYEKFGRIPLKREFNAWDIYKARFGNWNNAIKLAGFEQNPVLFAKKFIAKDGHKCDSFTEKIVDDWLFDNNINHDRHCAYENTKLTADFKIGSDIFIEFFGLAGVQNNYDKIIERKRDICRKAKIRLIEIYPKDVYPENNLQKLLGSLI